MNRRKRYILLFDAAAIKINPVNRRMAVGFPATFYCGASGYGNSYSWEEKAPGGVWRESHQFGAQSELLTVVAKASLNGYQYRCKVTNGGKVLYSSAATLTVVEVSSNGTSSKLQSADN